jgi:DNA-directed RNA polymerase subunit RPC12/RpoP
MENEIKKWECTDCNIKFEAPLKENGFLPDCPYCGIDYRVFEIK